jgi:hypothetical protein
MRLSSTHEAVMIYAGSKMISGIEQFITKPEATYNGITGHEIVTVVYEQGVKDGRREIIGQLEQVIGQLNEIKAKANYLPPGRPKRTNRR